MSQRLSEQSSGDWLLLYYCFDFRSLGPSQPRCPRGPYKGQATNKSPVLVPNTSAIHPKTFKSHIIIIKCRVKVPLSFQVTCHLMFEGDCRPAIRAQELCESRGGRPGLPSLISFTVSVDVQQHSTRTCKNYRPVSDLQFLSKLLGKVVSNLVFYAQSTSTVISGRCCISFTTIC